MRTRSSPPLVRGAKILGAGLLPARVDPDWTSAPASKYTRFLGVVGPKIKTRTADSGSGAGAVPQETSRIRARERSAIEGTATSSSPAR